jgi:hypothetical protein
MTTSRSDDATVRSLVRDMQVEIRDTELPPARAAELLTKLTALIGNCNDEIRVADAEYANTLLEAMRTEGAAARARVLAETTAQFQRKREARDTKELVQELIGGLKYLLRSLEAEMRLTR